MQIYCFKLFCVTSEDMRPDYFNDSKDISVGYM